MNGTDIVQTVHRYDHYKFIVFTYNR